MVVQQMKNCLVAESTPSPSPDVVADKKKTLATIYIVTSLLSIMFAASVIIYSLIKKSFQKAEVKPLFDLAVADFLLSSWWMLGAVLWMSSESDPTDTSEGMTCFYIDVIAELFHLASFFLTVNYGVNVYDWLCEKAKSIERFRISVNNHRPRTFLQRWKSGASLSWLFATMIMSPLAIHYHEQSSILDNPFCSRCLLLFDRPRPLKNAAFLKLFWYLYGSIVLVICLGLSILSLTVIYFLAHRIYQRCLIRSGFLTDTQRLRIDVLRYRICAFIVVFLYCWVPAFVVACVDLYTGEQALNISEWYPLFVVQGLTAPMQGFLNSLVYGWTRRSFRNAPRQRLLLDASEQSTLERSYGSLNERR